MPDWSYLRVHIIVHILVSSCKALSSSVMVAVEKKALCYFWKMKFLSSLPDSNVTHYLYGSKMFKLSSYACKYLDCFTTEFNMIYVPLGWAQKRHFRGESNMTSQDVRQKCFGKILCLLSFPDAVCVGVEVGRTWSNTFNLFISRSKLVGAGNWLNAAFTQKMLRNNST